MAKGRTPAPEVVRAQRFELVDDKGKERANLGVADDGSPSLALHDQKGEVIWRAP